MEIDVHQTGEYRVFRILEDVGLNSELSFLKSRIEKNLADGAKNVAIAFTPESYLYTKSIAVLIACSEMIKDAGGHLAIIEANKDILDILSVIDFDKMIRIVDKESDLATIASAPLSGE